MSLQEAQYSPDDTSGDWMINIGGGSYPLTLEPDSGWVVGQFQKNGGDHMFAIRSWAGRSITVEIYDPSGQIDYCDGEIAADGRGIAGTCERGGAYQLTR